MRAPNGRLVYPGILRTAALLSTLLISQVTFGADVTVHVSKRGASGPLDNVAVCLGTRGVPTQFGAVLTDKTGTAKFRDVPTTELVLTASKRGMRGKRTSLIASSWNRSLVMSLPSGGGGPECSAKTLASAAVVQSTRTDDSGPGLGVGIRGFRINEGKRSTTRPTVTLEFDHSGGATHYRVSERSDFRAAEWLPINGERQFDLSTDTSRKTVYLQVRKQVTVQGGAMESVSNVTSDSIVLKDG